MWIGGTAWRKLAMKVTVPGVAIGALAGFGTAPATAGVTISHKPPPQNESFRGIVRGVSGFVPIWASGVVSDNGYIDLTAPNPGDYVHLHHGSLGVSHSGDRTKSHVDQRSCTAVYTDNSDYTIDGGTGLYRHASGHGTARVRVTAVLQRDRDGTCNPDEPMPGSVYTSFNAHGSFTLGV